MKSDHLTPEQRAKRNRSNWIMVIGFVVVVVVLYVHPFLQITVK